MKLKLLINSILQLSVLTSDKCVMLKHCYCPERDSSPKNIKSYPQPEAALTLKLSTQFHLYNAISDV